VTGFMTVAQRLKTQSRRTLLENTKMKRGVNAPDEDPAELQSELEKSARELTLLIQRINRTNARVPIWTGNACRLSCRARRFENSIQRLPGAG